MSEMHNVYILIIYTPKVLTCIYHVLKYFYLTVEKKYSQMERSPTPLNTSIHLSVRNRCSYVFSNFAVLTLVDVYLEVSSCVAMTTVSL